MDKIKPNLILFEQNLEAGIKNPSYEYAVNLKADLITIFKFLIKYEKDLNIDFDFYEFSTNCKTYRCVSGWWAYWLNIEIFLTLSTLVYSDRFTNIFCNRNFFMCFEELVVLDSDGDYIKMFDLFFGDASCGTLQERLIRAEALEFSNKLIKCV